MGSCMAAAAPLWWLSTRQVREDRLSVDLRMQLSISAFKWTSWHTEQVAIGEYPFDTGSVPTCFRTSARTLSKSAIPKWRNVNSTQMSAT